MTAAVIAVALALLAGAGIWVRWLYAQRDRVPELVAALKQTADRRDEYAAALAVRTRELSELSDHARALARSVAELGTALRRSTDAQINAAPSDAPSQLAISGELLSRPWPGATATGTNGDRQGATTSTVQPPSATGTTSTLERPR